MYTFDNPIYLTGLTQDFYSGMSGLEVGRAIDKVIQNQIEQQVTLSLKGVSAIGPSFINGAFLYIFDLYGEQYFRQYIKILHANGSVSQALGEAFKGHIAYRKQFSENLRTNKVFLAVDGSAEANNWLLQVQKNAHDSAQYPPTAGQFLSGDIQLVLHSDSVIAVWANVNSGPYLFDQINFALANNKPVLLIHRDNLKANIPDSLRNRIQVFRYNEGNIHIISRNLNDLILSNRVNNAGLNPMGRNITANESKVWAALGVLGLLVLGAMVAGDKK